MRRGVESQHLWWVKIAALLPWNCSFITWFPNRGEIGAYIRVRATSHSEICKKKWQVPCLKVRAYHWLRGLTKLRFCLVLETWVKATASLSFLCLQRNENLFLLSSNLTTAIHASIILTLHFYSAFHLGQHCFI